MENRVKEFEEIRKAKRKVQNNTTCRFDNNTVEFPVYELSAHGFSFLCRKESCFFKRGAILDKISVLNSEKMEIIKGSGTVMHLADFDFDNLRIGVSYTKKTLDRTISGKVRVPRLTPRIRLDVEISLKHDGNGHILTGHVVDYTASTSRIKFIVQQPVDLKVGDEVNVQIKAEEKTLFEGEAFIFRTRDEGSEVVIRFLNQLLDVSKVEKTSNAFQNRSVIFSSLNSIKKFADVKDDYKALICDWRMYLSHLKQTLDKEESKNLYQTSASKTMFLQGIEDRIISDLNGFIAQMNPMVENQKRNEAQGYKYYFRENLNSYFHESPLIASILDKECGYSGDFETIKQFFIDPYNGETLFAKMINKFLSSMDAVTAHQHRIAYLYQELQQYYKNSHNDFRFMSLGSGPAEEIIRLIENTTFEKPVKATLLDMDAYALADFSDRLQYLPKANITVDLINLNIMSVLRSEEKTPLSNKFHFTYCAGLFDYFNDSICKRLVNYLIDQTLPGGTAIITNVHKNNFSRYVMDYGAGWEIMHRDEKQMEELIPKGYPIEMNLDKNHTNVFLKIMIPNSG